MRELRNSLPNIALLHAMVVPVQITCVVVNWQLEENKYFVCMLMLRLQSISDYCIIFIAIFKRRFIDRMIDINT